MSKSHFVLLEVFVPDDSIVSDVDVLHIVSNAVEDSRAFNAAPLVLLDHDLMDRKVVSNV